MNEPLAILEYSFLLEPKETFSNIYEFERKLAKFWDQEGYEAQILKTVEGVSARRILYIKKKQMVMEPPKNPPGRPLSVRGNLERLAPVKQSAPERNFKKGKFLPRKGYLKREFNQPK